MQISLVLRETMQFYFIADLRNYDLLFLRYFCSASYCEVPIFQYSF